MVFNKYANFSCFPRIILDSDGWLLFLLGDTHLGGGMDANGSTESFELVTEENNGEGKAKADSRSTFEVQVHLLIEPLKK